MNKKRSEALPEWLSDTINWEHSFPELNFLSHFLLMSTFRMILFWTQNYTTKHRANLSIKKLKIINGYLKPPCFNWLLKYCLTAHGQDTEHSSSQLSLLLLVQSLNLRAMYYRDFSNFPLQLYCMHCLAVPSPQTPLSQHVMETCTLGRLTTLQWHYNFHFPPIKCTSVCITDIVLKISEHLFDKPYADCPKVRVTILEKLSSSF